jgi:hypothetical protein
VPKLASPLLPEFLGVLGIDIFLVLSILTCLFDFPVVLQFIYHISAFIGFGQLWINYIFSFNEEMRFFIYLAYLIIGLANIVLVNVYMGATRPRRIPRATAFLCCVTVPFLLTSFSAVSCCTNKVAVSFPLLPLIPPEVIAGIMVVCAAVLVVSLILSTRGRSVTVLPILREEEEEVKTGETH